MAIHVPGYRSSNKRLRKMKSGKRSVVAVLSLTAMVDMFTVLTVFLLQNYNPDTGAVLDIPAEVQLPQATRHKELSPAHVITISNSGISFEKQKVFSLEEARQGDTLLLPRLKTIIERAIAQTFREHTESLGARFQDAVDAAKARSREDSQSYRKVTIQADKGVDFVFIKKVMHTASEAGAGEVNFAVLEKESGA